MTFTPEDFAAASKEISKLNLNDILAVIESGIPIDIPEYTLARNWSKTDMLELISIQCAYKDLGYKKKAIWATTKEQKKWSYEEYIEHIDNIVLELLQKFQLPITGDAFYHILVNKLYKSAKYLIKNGIDLNYVQYNKSFLEWIQEFKLAEWFNAEYKDGLPVKKIDIQPKKTSIFTLNKLNLLFEKYLEHLVSDLEFSLSQPENKIVSLTKNKFSLDYAFEGEYYKIKSGASISSQDLYQTFMESLLKLGKTSKIDKQKLLINAYQILIYIRCRVPLCKLQEMLDTQTILPYELVLDNSNWAWWEQEEKDDRDFTRNLLSINIHLDKKEEVKGVLNNLVDHFDDYLLAWKYTTDNFRVMNLSEKYKCYHEDYFFRAILPYTDLESYVVSYVEKITDHNKNKYVLYSMLPDDDTIPVAIGASAAGLMAFWNENNDEKLLEYINSIPVRYHDCTYASVFNYIKKVWTEGGHTPNLPKTFAVYPQLA